VAGGFELISYTTLFIPFTLFIMLNNANFYFTGRHLVWILLSFYGLGCVFMNNPFLLDGTLFISFSLILFIIDYFFKSIDLFYIGTFIGLAGGFLCGCVIAYVNYIKRKRELASLPIQVTL
jgi:hypothetical protein